MINSKFRFYSIANLNDRLFKLVKLLRQHVTRKPKRIILFNLQLKSKETNEIIPKKHTSEKRVLLIRIALI